MSLDTASRQMLQDSAREWLAATCPVSRFRQLRDEKGIVSDESIWQGMNQLGWPGILVAEGLGGLGLGMTELGVILEQAGRCLAPSPLLSTALIATSIFAASNNDVVARASLERIAQGDLMVALAVDEGFHHAPARIAATAARDGDDWLLSGRKTPVPDALSADVFIVSVRTQPERRLALFMVDAAAVTVEPLHMIDSRDHGAVTLDQVRVSSGALLAIGDVQCDVLDRALDRARIGLAAEMLGNAWAAFEMTIDYLKTREQFGQLIGTFQALQHRAAKMYVDLELARSAIEAALAAADRDDPDVPALASRAKALASEVLHLVTNEAIQLHGGIGMTDEHDAGLFLKRARVAEHLYGSPAFHRDRFARLRGF